MALTRVDTGLQSFPDFARNQQLASAQIYIGVPGLDPSILANQYQAYVVQEDGTEVSVSQPILTSAGGIPTYLGSPVQIAIEQTEYSIKILNSLGSQIYYFSDVQSPLSASNSAVSLENYAALRAYVGIASTVYITGVLITAQPQGIAGTFQYDPTDAVSADNGGTIIVGGDGRRWKRVFSGDINVHWFDAKGDGSTNDSAAINAASLAASLLNGSLYFPAGVYVGKNLFVYPFTKWHGDGNGSVIKLINAASSGDVLLKNKNCGTDINGSDAAVPGDRGIIIENMAFDGNKANQANQNSLVYWRRVQFSQIVGCKFFNSSGLAIDGCNAIDSNVIADNFFFNNYGNDIRILWVSNRNIITNNTIVGSNLPPVDGGESLPVFNDAIIISAQNVTASTNFNCAENIISNNVVKGKVVGVRLDGALETIMSGNVFGSQTNATILTQQTGTFACDGLEISANTITCEASAGSGGIVLVAAKRVSVSGNGIYSVLLPGIFVGSSAENTDIVIDGNNIAFTGSQDNSDCITLQDGSNTTISNNTLRFGRNGIRAPSPSVGVELRGLNIFGNKIVSCTRNGIQVANNGVGRVIRGVSIKDNTIEGCGTLAVNVYDSIFIEQSGGAFSDVYVDGNITFDLATNTRDHVRLSGTIDNVIVEPNIKVKGINGVLVTGYFNAAPATGTWYAGQRIYDFSPTPGANEGWICTTAGTPGTWKNFGTIAP